MTRVQTLFGNFGKFTEGGGNVELQVRENCDYHATTATIAPFWCAGDYARGIMQTAERSGHTLYQLLDQ